METIQSSFPSLHNIISEYNKPVYSAIYKIQYNHSEIKDDWFHKIYKEKKCAINFVINNLQKKFSFLYDVCDDEVQDKIKNDKEKYMYEGKISEKPYNYYYVKDEHKNEESLYKIVSMLNKLDGGFKVHSFSISEEHIL